MVDHAAMERCWTAHTDGEFMNLDLQATMSTMTGHPTVLHVPTAMGASGRREVSDFPLVAIVAFRDGAIDSEHIYWDQAAVLAQTGLIDPALAAQLPLLPDQVAAMDTGTRFNDLALRSA
ncbi:hypothetical protein [Streptomyces sp. NPDC059861]|uniref:hypothetical protein n=1 Tax=Streptomyces sp. NPDC059861 TaxID=3346974 RepID=UPI0036484C9C